MIRNEDELNTNWECYLCSKDFDFDEEPSGYLSNSYPLCHGCVDSVLEDQKHKQRFRLTYHYEMGDIQILANIPVQFGYQKLN